MRDESVGKKIRATWARKREAKWAAIRARGTLRCVGACKAVLPLAAFSERKDGAVHAECKACANERAKAHRRERAALGVRARTDREREVERAAHARRRVRDAEKMKAATKAWREKNRAKCALRHFLNDAVTRGKIIRPERCSACPNGAANGFRLAGYFPPGRTTLADVEWYCRPCYWAKTRGNEDVAQVLVENAATERRKRVRAMLLRQHVTERMFLLDVSCSPAEWRSVHEGHVAALEAERAEVSAHAARHGRRAGEMFELYFDWPEPERSRKVRAVLEAEGRR